MRISVSTLAIAVVCLASGCPETIVNAIDDCLLQPCPNGVCVETQVKDGQCYIDNTCFNSGQTMPGDECRWCEPSKSKLVAVGICAEGQTCQPGGVCISGDATSGDTSDGDATSGDTSGDGTGADGGPDAITPPACQAVDLLFVVDNSTSMCGEQLGLMDHVETFRSALDPAVRDNLRVAVTSVDMQCDTKNAAMGRLSTAFAPDYPAACYEKAQVECREDADCEVAGEEGLWKCTTENLDVCVINPNGSINSSCRRNCSSDLECQTLYGLDYQCVQPGLGSGSGCLREPFNSGCLDPMPPYLEGNDIKNYLSCSASVGVYSEKCFSYEQGFNAALAATDPAGPNAAIGFSRPGAFLAVVFLADEDDCSTIDGQDFNEDYYNTCALEPTSEDGGILRPVAEVANTLRSRVADPTKVVVAAIVGDSVGSDVAADRAAFVASKTDPRICHQKSYICEGPSGVADWGGRYQQLAGEFGVNGGAFNICNDIGEGLSGVASLLNGSVGDACGP